MTLLHVCRFLLLSGEDFRCILRRVLLIALSLFVYYTPVVFLGSVPLLWHCMFPHRLNVPVHHLSRGSHSNPDNIFKQQRAPRSQLLRPHRVRRSVGQKFNGV